ncbi:membrane-associated protein, putative [Bodo saltans]|uniref:Membrane-associated protein, putative n=1 Tax=Bodo saltans TaxID=75058 RepID=A0A0S4J6W1_BODSA|nr:membrane-associated protein, putative [Bodo saltans]|eukprot:CUG87198.1 membrane-associated protein, putative [Bodo saltans]
MRSFLTRVSTQPAAFLLSLAAPRRLSSGKAVDNTDVSGSASPPTTTVPPTPPTEPSSSTPVASSHGINASAADAEPARWIQPSTAETHPDGIAPILDEKGQYIVSTKQWPTGDVAYRTPEAPGHLAPRFGYNVLQVKKDVSWWQHYHKYPRFSMAYLNIQLIFLLGIAWLSAYISIEYRNMTDEMKTPGAMVGEQRGRGASNKGTQKISFTNDEMSALIGGAQQDWMEGKSEKNYVGSKDYRMKQISRPKEFSMEDFRKR